MSCSRSRSTIRTFPFAFSPISVVKRSRSAFDMRCSLWFQPEQLQPPEAGGKSRIAMRGFFAFSSFDSFAPQPRPACLS
jgi:hypothetical protein